MVEAGRIETKSWACMEAKGKFQPHTITRRAVGDKDVHIEIKYAGICHSDIHQAHEDWGPAIFPMVPGHEIAGVVVAVGKDVTKVKVGDHAGVGCMVESCRECPACKAGEENYCKMGMVGTYNSRMKYPHCPGYSENKDECEPTYGGYSKDIVVDERFACSIPKSIPLEKAAPLLCAGITVYSPLVYYGAKKDMRIGVAGLGGLGSMAVKFAKAMGCKVTVISRGTAKKEEALSKLGADFYVDSKNEAEVAAAFESLDQIINTISAEHDLSMYMNMLDRNGKMICVGAAPSPHQVSAFAILFRRKSICGSLIGGMPETQAMLDFCGEHNIACDVEVCKPDYIDEAYKRTMNSDVRWRFSIDCSQM